MNTQPKRYIYQTVPISREEAQKLRDEEVEHKKLQLEHLSCELQELVNSPLRMDVIRQIEVHPDDPGFPNAPMELDVIMYQGDMEWKDVAP